MVVERWVIPVKPGLYEEVGAMLKGVRSTFDDPNSMRIYYSEFGEMSSVCYELEHESMAALEQGWKEWKAAPGTPDFLEKWNELVVGHGTRELWTLVE